jgi:hypothetical protein
VIHTTHQQQYIINVQAGAVGDQVVGPHELTEISHGLTKPPEDVPLAQPECGTRLMVLRHIVTVLCGMFPVAPLMTDGRTQESPLHGLEVPRSTPRLNPLDGNRWGLAELLLTANRHIRIELRMPVRLSTTAPAALMEWDGP